jgi:hypothetical protein
MTLKRRVDERRMMVAMPRCFGPKWIGAIYPTGPIMMLHIVAPFLERLG